MTQKANSSTKSPPRIRKKAKQQQHASVDASDGTKITVPVPDMMITELSFYGMFGKHLMENAKVGDCLLMLLINYLDRMGVTGFSWDALMLLVTECFPEVQYRVAEGKPDALLVTSEVLTTAALRIDWACFQKVPEFRECAIRALMESAKAIVEEQDLTGLRERFTVRPLDRVVNRFVQYARSRGPQCSQWQTLALDFAGLFAANENQDVAPGTAETLWWAVKERLERAYLEQHGRPVSFDPQDVINEDLSLGHFPFTERANDKECTALLYMSAVRETRV